MGVIKVDGILVLNEICRRWGLRSRSGSTSFVVVIQRSWECFVSVFILGWTDLAQQKIETRSWIWRKEQIEFSVKGVVCSWARGLDLVAVLGVTTHASEPVLEWHQTYFAVKVRGQLCSGELP